VFGRNDKASNIQKCSCSKLVEDEIHFIFECSTYEQYRKEFIIHMKKENKNSSLSNNYRVIWLMSNESSNVIYSFAGYISKFYMKDLMLSRDIPESPI
jgi:hypothetical protein